MLRWMAIPWETDPGASPLPAEIQPAANAWFSNWHNACALVFFPPAVA